MASIFRDDVGDVTISLDTAERQTLTSLAQQVIDLLEPDGETAGDVDPLETMVGLSSAPVAAPDDEVLARLLPTAYQGEDEASVDRAAEFRRYTDADLRATKAVALRTILSAVARDGDIRLAGEQHERWLHGLNDLRLALGTRLGITEDLEAEAMATDQGTPRWEGLVLYDWLSLLQDSLIRAAAD